MVSLAERIKSCKDGIMHRIVKDAWHDVLEAREKVKEELAKECRALETSLRWCGDHIDAMRDFIENGDDKIDGCHSYKLLENAGRTHRLVAKIQLLQRQLETYDNIIDPPESI